MSIIPTNTEESTSLAMHNPPHPGGILRQQCLEPLGLSVTYAAIHLGVARQSLSELVNERSGVSVDMAIRLSKAFGSSPESWLGVQMAYDLSQARSRIDEIKVKQIQAALPTVTLTRFPSWRKARSIVAALVAWSGFNIRRTSLSATPRSRARPRCETPASRKAP